MKTTIVFVVEGITASALVVSAEGHQRALGFAVRSQEGARIRIEGHGSIDAIRGHLRLESNTGLAEDQVWNTVAFHPASLGMPAAYGLEMKVDPGLLESLIADARLRPPVSLQLEIDGLTPDFNGAEVQWMWDPIGTPRLAVHSFKIATSLRP